MLLSPTLGKLLWVVLAVLIIFVILSLVRHFLHAIFFKMIFKIALVAIIVFILFIFLFPSSSSDDDIDLNGTGNDSDIEDLGDEIDTGEDGGTSEITGMVAQGLEKISDKAKKKLAEKLLN